METRTKLNVIAVTLGLLAGCSSSSSTSGAASDASTARDSGPPGHDARLPSPDAVVVANDAAHADAFVAHDAGSNDATRIHEAATDAGIEATSPEASSANTCSDGTPVSYTRSSCPGTPASVPAGVAAAITSGALGDVLSLDGLDDSSLPCFPAKVCVPAGAPTLLFSDDPESPATDGVLYADALTAGAYRAYVYHTNADVSLRKFPIVLLNQGTTTVHATLLAKGIAGPSEDYVDVGKQALLRWSTSETNAPIATVDVPAGERVLLDSDLDAVHADTNELAHAIIDFTVDGPVKLSVVSVLSTEDATMVTSGLSLLPNDGMHQRGSFPGANLEIESIGQVDGAGARHLRIGGNVTDTSLTGHDYVDNTTVTLDGNYGVLYAFRVDFAVASGLALSPQGGDWGGVAMAAAAPSLLPASQDALGTQTDAIVLAAYASGTTATLHVVSAGGSSLPVDLVSVPTQ